MESTNGERFSLITWRHLCLSVNTLSVLSCVGCCCFHGHSPLWLGPLAFPYHGVVPWPPLKDKPQQKPGS
ncbi:hypothetical protein GN956_G19100 [Arapaima gigas]